MAVEEVSLRLETGRLLPERLQGLPLLCDSSIELRGDLIAPLALRRGGREVLRERLVERREGPPLVPVVLPQVDRGRVDGPAAVGEERGPSFLVHGHREVVQGCVQGVDLAVDEILDPRLLRDPGQEAKLLRVLSSEVDDARKKTDLNHTEIMDRAKKRWSSLSRNIRAVRRVRV